MNDKTEKAMDFIFKLTEQRATIFVAPISYNLQNLETIKGIVNSYEKKLLPINMSRSLPFAPISNVKMTSRQPIFEWGLLSEDYSFQIHFDPQKIDIIECKKNNEATSFCNKCSNIFEEIQKNFDTKITRLAYAPRYQMEYSDEKVTLLNNQIYKKTFNGYNMINFELRQAYMIPTKLEQKDIALYYNVQGSIIKNPEKGSSIEHVVDLLFDINTKPKKNYTFIPAEIRSFFKQSPDFAASFLDFYTHN